MATLEQVDKMICLNNEEGKTSVQDRVYDTKGIMPTVTAEHFNPKIAMFNPYNKRNIDNVAPTQTTKCGNIYSSAAVLISEDREYYFRIRKLTPKECWRLMRI